MHTDKYKKFTNLHLKIVIIVVLCVGVGGIFILWKNQENIFPNWVTWNHGTLEDSSGQYEIILARRKVSVRHGNHIIWTSPQDVKVQKALFGDIDRDGQDELLLLCWRKGHYGDVKPIWVEEDEKDWVQHIFVYEFSEEDVEAKWMSSYIGRDILNITIKEKETDGCFICLTDTGGEESFWTWDSWGFKKVEINK